MKTTNHKNLGLTYFQFSGPIDAATTISNYMQKPNVDWKAAHIHNKEHLGKEILSWSDVPSAFNTVERQDKTMFNNVLTKIRGAIDVQPMCVKRKLRWDDSEGDIDLDRALSGEPEFYGQHKRVTSRSADPITIIASVSAPVYMKPEDIFWSGAATCCVIDMIEEAGYQTEVIVCSGSENVYEDYTFKHQFSSMKIKGEGDPLDVDSIINATSPWFFRTVLVRPYWTTGYKVKVTDRKVKKNGEWYTMSAFGGTAMEKFPMTWKALLDIPSNVRCIEMPMQYEVTNLEQSVEAVKKALKSLEEVHSMG